jgi:hypothetical protein
MCESSRSSSRRISAISCSSVSMANLAVEMIRTLRLLGQQLAQLPQRPRRVRFDRALCRPQDRSGLLDREIQQEPQHHNFALLTARQTSPTRRPSQRRRSRERLIQHPMRVGIRRPLDRRPTPRDAPQRGLQQILRLTTVTGQHIRAAHRTARSPQNDQRDHDHTFGRSAAASPRRHRATSWPGPEARLPKRTPNARRGRSNGGDEEGPPFRRLSDRAPETAR